MSVSVDPTTIQQAQELKDKKDKKLSPLGFAFGVGMIPGLGVDLFLNGSNSLPKKYLDSVQNIKAEIEKISEHLTEDSKKSLKNANEMAENELKRVLEKKYKFGQRYLNYEPRNNAEDALSHFKDKKIEVAENAPEEVKQAAAKINAEIERLAKLGKMDFVAKMVRYQKWSLIATGVAFAGAIMYNMFNKTNSEAK